MNTLITLFQEILAYYGLILIIIGTLSNLINFFICFHLSKNQTFIFLCYLSILNILIIYHWNADYILRFLFGIDWLNFSILVCKLLNFIQYSSSQSAAWILVLISAEQFMSVKIKLWRSNYYSARKAFWTAFSLTAVIFLINSNVLIFLGHQEIVNGTLVDFCFNGNITDYATYYGYVSVFIYFFRFFFKLNFFFKFHLANYSLLPFIIMLSLNLLLWIELNKSKARLKDLNYSSDRSAKSLTKSIIKTCLLFVLMTLPNALVSLMYTWLAQSDLGFLIIRIGDLFSFTFHGFNLFINLYVNKKFRLKCRRLISRTKTSIVSK